MFRYILVLFFISFTHNNYAFLNSGGSLVGNGGDTLFCHPSNLNNFQGHYTLDYILEYRTQQRSIIELSSFKKYNSHIRNNLLRIYPELLPQFDDYFNNLFKKTSTRQWSPYKGKLNNINDENIIKKLPLNCLDKSGSPILYQTAIRVASKNPITYYFDEKILNNLKNSNPLQFSLFVTHEWLWDLTHDVRVLRKLNLLLHQESFNSLDRAVFIKKVGLWNIFNPKRSYCERSNLILKILPTHCSDTSARGLRAVEEVTFQNIRHGSYFRFGDFHGFASVKKLEIKNTLNLSSLLNPRIFRPLLSLKHLVLSNNDLNSLSLEVLKDLKSVQKLELQFNNSLNLSHHLQYLKSLKVLYIDENATVESLPSSLEKIVIFVNDGLHLSRWKSLISQRYQNVILEIKYYDL